MLKTHVEKRANFFQLYKCSFVENYLVYVGCRFFSRLFTGVFFAKKNVCWTSSGTKIYMYMVNPCCLFWNQPYDRSWSRALRVFFQK
jgi:hypothetical protein